jgi:hypothetical protein
VGNPVEIKTNEKSDWMAPLLTDAEVYAYRGESDKSFEWLERAYEQRDAGVSLVKTDPLMKNLRHDPRYTELLARWHCRHRSSQTIPRILYVKVSRRRQVG